MINPNFLPIVEPSLLPFTAEFQDFFSQELALQAADAPRDWRKLRGRLRGSFGGTTRQHYPGGYNSDTLQGFYPVLAPQAGKYIKFQDPAYKLAMNLMASWLVSGMGEGAVAPVGQPGQMSVSLDRACSPHGRRFMEQLGMATQI